MPYIKEICVAGKVIECSKYHSSRYGKKGDGRGPRAKPSSEAMIRANIRKQTKGLRREMNNNFRDKVDALVTLDFDQIHYPADSFEMISLIQKGVRKLRGIYKKKGKTLKYIYCREIGPRGCRHVHMMLSNADLKELCEAWTYGAVNVEPLHTNGQYRDAAEYFMKYSLKTEKTEGKLIGRRFNPSQNLIKPVSKKTIVLANTFSERIHDIKGYYLEKESIQQGVSEITGKSYLSYTYIADQTERKRKEMNFDIYLQTTIRGPRAQEGAISCAMEAQTSGEPVRKTHIKITESNISGNTAELMALKLAADHIKPGSGSHITIHSDSGYVTLGLYQLKKWQAGNWENAKGKPVANAKIWQSIAAQLKGNTYESINESGKKDSWRSYLQREMRAELEKV